ncbi:hypothetical protein LOAG_07648 [Loa loa]|uniref:Uncharacterized protein n=1 Tax=Loa loa TaxID=7209 RepID=A0A1S0TV65_LOALO|nr:hypothetical protein LOAG_07648 [Loa loa]EFO20841.1 hypothetical protein LOAG_07648 [Loa loa]
MCKKYITFERGQIGEMILTDDSKCKHATNSYSCIEVSNVTDMYWSLEEETN